jgi:glycosyltransferase involved in cell wall biosynthesis
MGKPFVSILVPTTLDRIKFGGLLLKNILSQTYPHDKLELVIVGDENPITKRTYESMFKNLPYMRCRYVECNIYHSIGLKRNFACTKASHDFIVNMDDDDIYNKAYIEHSIDYLRDMNLDIVGCKDMLITWPKLDFETRYIVGSSIHEGTMVYRKKHWKKYKFKDSKYAEGSQMVKGRCFNKMDIRKVMLCVSHENNTYDKTELLKHGAIVILSQAAKDGMKKIMDVNNKLNPDR